MWYRSCWCGNNLFSGLESVMHSFPLLSLPSFFPRHRHHISAIMLQCRTQYCTASAPEVSLSNTCTNVERCMWCRWISTAFVREPEMCWNRSCPPSDEQRERFSTNLTTALRSDLCRTLSVPPTPKPGHLWDPWGSCGDGPPYSSTWASTCLYRLPSPENGTHIVWL